MAGYDMQYFILPVVTGIAKQLNQFSMDLKLITSCKLKSKGFVFPDVFMSKTNGKQA